MPIPTSRVHAFVQAGGKGERLRPATDDRPKPMIEVGGVPMIERLVRQIAESGIGRITVITGYRGELIRDHLIRILQTYPSTELDFYLEDTPLGNVGSLGRVEVDRPLAMLVFGDLVTDFKFDDFIARHQTAGTDVYLASHYETHRLQLGELHVDGERVTRYQEKPTKQYLICSGIASFRKNVLNLVPTDSTSFGLADLVSAALAHRYTVAHWLHGAFWMDVNSPEALAQADARIRSLISSPPI